MGFFFTRWEHANLCKLSLVPALSVLKKLIALNKSNKESKNWKESHVTNKDSLLLPPLFLMEELFLNSVSKISLLLNYLLLLKEVEKRRRRRPTPNQRKSSTSQRKSNYLYLNTTKLIQEPTRLKD